MGVERKTGNIINQDVLAGLMFAGFGAFFLYFGRNYNIGTTRNMGPGYLPLALGVLLVVIGIFVGVRGTLSGKSESLGRWAFKPLILVAAALLLFAGLIERTGFVIAAIVCMMVAALAGTEFRWREQLIIAVAAAAICAVGFIYFLGLTMRYWPVGY